jgi:N-dimethylarginine dimethylaminohydrolase
MERMMCPPTYFQIEYSINPWMDTDVKVDPDRAYEQWHTLVETLEGLGDIIHVIEAEPGLPDMTFSGDVGLVYRRTFVPSTFRHAERAGEVAPYAHWFEHAGFTISPMPDGVFFEGLGDVVFHEGAAIVGHGYRSDERALDHLKSQIPDMHVLASVEMVDDHYFHLAMALGFVDASTVVCYEPAFTPQSLRAIRAAIPRLISVSEVDANRYFACNNLVIGDTVLLDNATPQLRADLAAAGYGVTTINMSEFKKSGGSLRCCVLTFM